MTGVTSLIIMTCVFWPPLVLAASKDDYYELYTYLFEDKDFYKKTVRPASNEQDPLVVDVFFFLNSIIDIDEKEQTMLTSGTLQLMWSDNYLSWNATEFGEIITLLVPQSNIYLPDVIIHNSVRATQQLGYSNLRVRLSHAGVIIWEPNVLFVTSCDIDITYFPFDTQRCYITLATAVSRLIEIELRPNIIEDDDSISLLDFTANGQWILVETGVDRMLSKAMDKPKIQYGILLKRRRTFYMLNILMPVFFLSLTSSLVFALPADEGEKMGTGITVLLAFAVYLTIVTDLVPNTSLQVSVLALYLTTLLGLCAVSVVVCAFILRLHFRDEDWPVGPKTTRLTRILQRLTCSKKQQDIPNNKIVPQHNSVHTITTYGEDTKSEGTSNETTDPSIVHKIVLDERDDERLTWKEVAKTLDEFCFILFSSLSILITGLCLLILIIGGHLGAPIL